MNSIRDLIADDSFAIGFQTVGQYRTALLKALDALPPAPEVGEGPSKRIISIAKAVQENAFGWEPDARLIGNVCAEDVADLCSAILARWGHPAAPPAPEVGDQHVSQPYKLPEAGEVGLLVDMLNQGAGDLEFKCNKLVNGECRTGACLRRGGWIRGYSAEPPDPSVATCPELELACAMRRAATLLQQLSATAPAVVPVAFAERLPGEGPTNEEFLAMRSWSSHGPTFDSDLVDFGRRCYNLAKQPVSTPYKLQQLSEPAPVAVSERLPGPGDLDANGRCWVYQNGNSTTHWLPASAIPLPQAGELEG
jgi:hypothetical protein